MSWDDHDGPRKPAHLIGCRTPSDRPLALSTIEAIADALMQHSSAAFAARNDARATRLRDIADELLGKDKPRPATSHDC